MTSGHARLWSVYCGMLGLMLTVCGGCDGEVTSPTPVGIITTVAGSGRLGFRNGGFSGDGGPATEARLNFPMGVALDEDGTLYIADTFNERIRKVDPTGIITTVAGTGVTGFSGNGGPATEAELSEPNGLAVGTDGSLYIAESGNSVVRKVDPTGIITTVAGTGVPGFRGDGGPATEAELASPFDVALGVDGSLYIADAGGSRIRKVDPAGIITTVAGTGTGGFSGDGGPATQAQLLAPSGVALGADGALYIADNGNFRIRKIDRSGIITTVAGTGERRGGLGDGGPATQAHLLGPLDVALDAAEALYIADSDSHRVRKVSP